MRIRFDLLAFATNATPLEADDGLMNGLLDGSDDALKTALDDAVKRFKSGFIVQADGKTVTPAEFTFPTVADIRRYLQTDPHPRLPVTMDVVVSGTVGSARKVGFLYPSLLGNIIQTVEFPYQEPISEPVEPGNISSLLTVPTPAEIAKAQADMNRPRVAPPAQTLLATPPAQPDGKPVNAPQLAPKTPTKPTSAPSPVPSSAEKPSAPVAKPSSAPEKASVKESTPAPEKPEKPEKSAATVSPPPPVLEVQTTRDSFGNVSTYFRMGFTHILPQGLDHILFVLGLCLLVGKNMKALLTQVTAFTLAHSITLALTALGIVHLPASIIEPVIAISIAAVAIENLFAKEVKPWRTAIVFLFGLIHGMGFAEVFKDAGLQGKALVTALVSFNVGVEAGQLAVVGLFFVTIGSFREDKWYRNYVVIPGSILIALVAIFWTFQRLRG